MKRIELLSIVLPSILLLYVPSVLARQAIDQDETAQSRAQEENIVATVNGEQIFFEDLERLLGDLHTGTAETQRRAPDPERMIFRLVNDKLLAQEARVMGMQNDEPIPSRLAALRQSMAIRRLEQEEIWTLAEPTDEELAQAFAKEYQTITFRMITVHEKGEAERLLSELEQGADFAALAKESSVDQFGPRGGLLEDLPRIDMPHELADDAFAMRPGELKGPFRTRVGWSHLRVESFADPDPEQFETLKPSLRALVRYRKADSLKNDLGSRLRQAHPVTIEQQVVAAIVAERLPDSRLMPKVENPELVVARVGEREISAEEYGKALQARWKGVRNEEAAIAAKPLVLERLIRDELMAAEALARGYGNSPEVGRALSATETQLLIPRMLNEVVGAGIDVTQEEMESYYEEHRNQFHRPPRVRIGQITVANREEAERLAELLRQGADLAWLVRQHSIDDFKDVGGDRGWITPTRSGDPIEEALFEAHSGNVLGPAEIDGSFVVVRVMARDDQGIFNLQEISGNIRQAVFDLKFQESLHEYMQKLRSRSEIVVNED
ncbi:MAG: peptidyl-prolyl cis-trans isomerase, partial [Thermoanaerobaculia bacterium]